MLKEGVDGANNDQAFFSEARGRSIGAPYVYPVDAIKEFSSENSGYSAEFGQAAGGIINAVTKADVQAFAMKFNTVIDRLTEMVRRGVPKDQLLMQLKTDDIGWAPRIPAVDGLYNELSTNR